MTLTVVALPRLTTMFDLLIGKVANVPPTVRVTFPGIKPTIEYTPFTLDDDPCPSYVPVLG